jgi:hypothetical protein
MRKALLVIRHEIPGEFVVPMGKPAHTNSSPVIGRI